MSACGLKFFCEASGLINHSAWVEGDVRVATTADMPVRTQELVVRIHEAHSLFSRPTKLLIEIEATAVVEVGS